MIPYWIQHADFSSDDFDPVDYRQATVVIQAYDWTTELRNQADREAAGEEACDSGVGFVAPEGRILHICPGPGGQCYFHYHFTESRKILGLIPASSQSIRSAFDVPVSDIPDVIYRFFNSDHDWLVSNTQSA